MKTQLISGSIGTSFEQYKDLNVRLGLSASYDDLRTEECFISLKKTKWKFFRTFQLIYGFTFDKRE